MIDDQLERLAWLQSVAADRRMAGASLAVAVRLAWHCNTATGDARPSVVSLAEAISIDERTARRALRRLADASYIEGELSMGGRSRCTSYRLINPGTDAPVTAPANPGTDAPVTNKPGHPRPETRASTSRNPGTDAPRTGTEQGQNKDCLPKAMLPAGAELSEAGLRAEESGAAFTLKGGSIWHPPKALIDKLDAAYPDINREAEMGKAAAWCEAHPTRRKTARGMGKFLNGWMGRAKPALEGEVPARGDASGAVDWDAAVIELQRQGRAKMRAAGVSA
ncbi:MAG: hypothetical protein ACOCXA_02570 [Planctomycetota bacterium]